MRYIIKMDNSEWKSLKMDWDGYFEYQTNYYRKLTRAEQRQMPKDIKFYENNKELSYEITVYYDGCIEERKRKKNLYMKEWRLKKKEQN